MATRFSPFALFSKRCSARKRDPVYLGRVLLAAIFGMRGVLPETCVRFLRQPRPSGSPRHCTDCGTASLAAQNATLHRRENHASQTLACFPIFQTEVRKIQPARIFCADRIRFYADHVLYFQTVFRFFIEPFCTEIPHIRRPAQEHCPQVAFFRLCRPSHHGI